jgi:hypothetical protein
MTPFGQDYLMRMVEQLTAVIARMLGLRKSGRATQALAEAEHGYDLLGLPSGLIDVVSAPALAELLGSPEKIRLVADLLEEEAASLDALGDPRAALKRTLAAELRRL